MLLRRLTSPMTTRVLILALACGILMFAAVPSALAQAPTPSDDQVNAIAKQLYCPVCENVPLDVCPTEACRQWRELIRLQLSEGRTEDEIKEYFVLNYGARVLAEPPRTGLNWLVYVLPPAMILGGAWVLFRAFRSWTKPQAAPGEPSVKQDTSDAYVSRLEEELKKRA